jgi:hypothetical protein
MRVPLAGACLILALLPGVADARVVRFIVEERELLADGASWGAAGPYERIVGTAYIEVDPRDPRNAVIVDLDLAPKNARGLVELSTTFFILKPVDPTRGNGKIYYTANNRGNDALFAARTVAQVGRNDFPLRMGYTIVDAGWQGDLIPSPTRLSAKLPIAVQPDGSPIVGTVRVEFSDQNIPREGTFTLSLKASAFRPYEAAVTDTARARLIVRDSPEGPASLIPPDRWAFGRCPQGQASLTASSIDVCLFDGFKNQKLYEVIYTAKNPIVMGLGHVTTRDVASFLRYDKADHAGNPNPLSSGGTAAGIRRAYATGASQTGAYLRDFMYLGFNEDESGRRVFDGIIPTIAGTLRVFINVRFADPNVFAARDDRRGFLQNSRAPFTYGVTTDPISGVRDGVLKRPATDPLVLHADSSTEFWQLRASLNVVDGAVQPVQVPETVRLYLSSSTSHGFGVGGLLAPEPIRNARCRNPLPTGSGDLGRALLVAMDAWADRGVAPPASNYPRLEDGSLVTAEAARKVFPHIPGMGFPAGANELTLLDFGPQFGRFGGVLTVLPPLSGSSYPVLVPKADADGLDLAGVRAVQVRVPLGTTTGWNVRERSAGVLDLCGLSGSYMPFARTKAERLAAGDPRLSLEERYATQEGFVRAVVDGVRELVEARFLVPEDAERYVAAARQTPVLK